MVIITIITLMHLKMFCILHNSRFCVLLCLAALFRSHVGSPVTALQCICFVCVCVNENL